MSVWGSAFSLKGLTSHNCAFLCYSHRLNLFQWFILKIPNLFLSCIDPAECGVATVEKWTVGSLASLITATVLPGGSSVVE